MKRALFLALFVAILCASTSGEAIVLPAGTKIIQSETSFIVLAETNFLLSRSDMEEATLALETVAIQDAALKRYAKMEKWFVPAIVTTGVVGVALGVVSTLLVRSIAK